VLAAAAVTRAQAYLAPTLLAVALIVHAYAPTHSHWSVMLRPGLVVLAATLLLTFVLLTILRRPTLVAAIVCWLLVLAYEWRVALIIAAAAALLIALRRIVLYRTDVISPYSLLVPVGLFLALGVLRVIVNGTITLADFAIPSAAPAEAASDVARPNVYLLLVDGYPRQDTLAGEFGYDNEPFLQELEDLSFAVNREATTTYAVTALSLSSMLGSSTDALAAYVTDGQYGPELSAEPREVRRQRLVDSEALTALRDLRYRLVYVPPPVADVRLGGWDETHDSGHLNDFETALLQQTPVRALLGGWVLDQARDRVADTLDEWSRPEPGQRLVFAHLMAPHPPFMWDDEGDVERPLGCWLANTCGLFAGFGLGIPLDDYARRMVPQVDALNGRLLSAVQRIVADDPEAIIAIFADHGTRVQSETSAEAHRTLFAARGASVTGIDGLLVELASELAAGS
jgi:hypothetical protein